MEKDFTPDILISIHEASQMLGVSEVALRQWTDEGKVKAFITPGGHRRYSRAELKKLVSTHSKALGIKDLVLKLEDSFEEHREISREAVEHNLQTKNISGESHEHLAQQGRRLLNLIIKYITEPSRRNETIEEVRAVGREHGVMLADLGLPLSHSVEAFLVHRDPIISAATQIIKKKEGFTGRVVEAIPLCTHVMDEALVSLVAAHQQHYKKFTKKLGGGL
ncbi:MAG: MerR family transcriptional regulator [Dehalococcoidales bacterium]|nr:MerR family transcriptional regulator [Dehalococcoidales bacterium]